MNYSAQLILKADHLKLDHFRKQQLLQRPLGAVSSTNLEDLVSWADIRTCREFPARCSVYTILGGRLRFLLRSELSERDKHRNFVIVSFVWIYRSRPCLWSHRSRETSRVHPPSWCGQPASMWGTSERTSWPSCWSLAVGLRGRNVSGEGREKGSRGKQG